MSLKRASWTSIVGSALFTSLLARSGCGPISIGGGGGSGGGGSDAVNVNVHYTFASGGAPRCTGSVTWVYTPLSLTGSAGRAERIVEPETYDVTSDASNQCTFGAGQPGLRKGTWRIQSGGTGGCDVNLHTTTTYVTFRQGAANCTTLP
jgi:hypothetical protein